MPTPIRIRFLLPLLLVLMIQTVTLKADDKTMNVPLAIELLTQDGIDVIKNPDDYEQFTMDLVVQLEATHLESLIALSEQGNDDAQTLLGLLYSLPDEAGEGRVMSNLVIVPSDKMRNYVDDFKWPATQLVQRDPEQARALLEKAAAQKNTLAETLLAETIMQTQDQKPDFELSREYFHRAALKQHTRAQIGLLQVSAILEKNIEPAIMRQIFSEMTEQ